MPEPSVTPKKDFGKTIGNIFGRDALSSILTPFVGIIIGLLITAVILTIQGVNPWEAYHALYEGAFGSLQEFAFTLVEFIPLAFAGLAVTIAYRGGIFNIGAEGQIYIAALVTTMVAIHFGELPKIILLPFSMLSGVFAAGLYALIPGYLKAKKSMNEVVITMLMNYVAIYLVGTAVNSFLKEPGQNSPQSAMIPKSARIPILIERTYLHWGIVVVFVAAAAVYYILFHTTWGYEIRSIGLNRKASKYSGISVEKNMMLVMCVSGMLAGFAGSMVILGIQTRLVNNFLVNYGYDAIPVALLGGLNPVGVLFTAFLFGALKNGGNNMQISMGIPVSVVSIVNAVAILSIIAISRIKFLYSKRRKGGEKH